MGKITHSLPWQMSWRGFFDEKGYFTSIMGDIEICAYCVYEERHSPLQKEGRDIFY